MIPMLLISHVKLIRAKHRVGISVVDAHKSSVRWAQQ